MSDTNSAAELLSRGKELLRSGNQQELPVICACLLSLPAADAEAWNQRGILCFRAGEYAAAATCWQNAHRLEPATVGFLGNWGVALRRLERWEEAEHVFTLALEREPTNVEIRLHFARALLAQGKFVPSEEHARAAAERALQRGPALTTLGIALQRQGRLAEAAKAYQSACEQQPPPVDALANLALCLRDLEHYPAAAECYRRLIELRPLDPQPHLGLGVVLLLQKQPSAALDVLTRACELDPTHADAHTERGSALVELGRREEAIAAYRVALTHAPQFAKAWTNLGVALRDLRRRQESCEALEIARKIAPDSPEVLNNLGIVYKELGELIKAEQALRQALVLRPEHWSAVFNLANVLLEQGEFAASEDLFRRAIAMRPEQPEPRMNLGMLRLLQGDFAAGLDGYELRWEIKHEKQPHRPLSSAPAWNGEPLAGKTIVVFTEQGYGDAFQFIRYAKLLKERGARVLLETRPQLIPLLRSCAGIEQFIPRGAPLPPHDYLLPLLSLPRAFGTRIDSIPAEPAYLAADRELTSRWREKLAAIPGLRVGIAWQGSVTYLRDFGRSIPLAHFAPLADVPGISLISLQLGPGKEQLSQLERPFPVIELEGEIDRAHGAFQDTAAILANLDLVISSDTAVVHLAGALGVPCWVAVGVSPDWRWFLERTDSPWYPSLKLFRQTTFGEWNDVFKKIREELQRFAQQPRVSIPTQGREVGL